MAYLRPESEGLADGCSKRIEIRWKQEENQRSGEERRGEKRRTQKTHKGGIKAKEADRVERRE